MWIDHNLCIVFGYLDHFQFDVTRSNAVMSIVLHVFWCICVYIFCQIYYMDLLFNLGFPQIRVWDKGLLCRQFICEVIPRSKHEGQSMKERCRESIYIYKLENWPLLWVTGAQSHGAFRGTLWNVSQNWLSEQWKKEAKHVSTSKPTWILTPSTSNSTCTNAKCDIRHPMS